MHIANILIDIATAILFLYLLPFKLKNVFKNYIMIFEGSVPSVNIMCWPGHLCNIYTHFFFFLDIKITVSHITVSINCSTVIQISGWFHFKLSKCDALLHRGLPSFCPPFHLSHTKKPSDPFPHKRGTLAA